MRISDWSSDVCSSDLVILSRPPVLEGLNVEVLAGPTLKLAPLAGARVAMAGRMVLADDDQPRVMAVDPRSCRPGRRSAVDVHPRWRAAAQAGGDAVGAGRAGLREEAAEGDERKARCGHHIARAGVAPRGAGRAEER